MLMPIIRRVIFEPFHARIARSPKLRYWKELEKSQFFPEEQLLEIQWRRLKKMLHFVSKKK
jgi:phenylacetate-CoA ligase